MSDPELLFDCDGPLATVTFNRPASRNALTWNMYDRLEEACHTVDTRDELRVLILRSAGGPAFAAGTDIRQFQDFQTETDALDYERRLDRVVSRLEAVSKPTIAAVNGAAAGAGALMAVVCDLRYCTPISTFGVPIARTLGNCLSAANYARIVELLGPAHSKELMFRAHMLSADDAARVGMVNGILPTDGFHEEVRRIALEIASRAPITLRVTKEALRRITVSGRRAATEDLTVQAYMSADFREGVRAFVGKRTPVFRGK